MKKTGFTLIELLAVIVILAIIALIAYPTITGIVEKTKMGGAEQSANGFIHAVENQKAINLMDSNDENDLNDGVYDANMDSYNVKVKGEKPKKGWVEVTKNGVNRYSLVIGDYVVSYDGTDKTVVKGTEPKKRPLGPTILYGFTADVLFKGDLVDYQDDIYRVKSRPAVRYGLSGTYSTNINDVLNLKADRYGNPIEERNNSVYLKIYLDANGKVEKTDVCLVMPWGTLCQTGESRYTEAEGAIDPNYEKKKEKLFNFFKWNPETEKSEYDGIRCDSYFDEQVSAEKSYCWDSSHSYNVLSNGNIRAYDDSLSPWLLCSYYFRNEFNDVYNESGASCQ